MTSQTLAGFVALAGCGKDNDYAPAAIKVNVTGVETKALTTTAGMKGDPNGFVLDAWVDGDYKDGANTITERHYINKAKVTYGSEWAIAGSPNWISGVNTSFWAWYPASTNGTMNISAPATPDAASISFGYTMPAEAEDSDDIVFAHASKEHQSTGATDEDTISLEFHHAMAQVRFAVCTTDGSFCTDFDILSIMIEDLKNNGTCTYIPGNAKFSKFQWTGLSGNSTMSQAYDADFSPTVDSNWKLENGLYVASQTFFIIPQQMRGLEVTIRFNKNGIPETDTVTINESYDFSQGKTYTFKINAKESKTTFDSPVSIKLIGISHENYADGGMRPF